MQILHLGVIEVPYNNEPPAPRKVAKARKGKQRPRGKKKTPNQTTGDVAEILERKYHLLETFYDLHEEEIAEMMAESMADAISAVVNGAPATMNPLSPAYEDIRQAFRKYLETAEIEGTATPGVPTKAALRGVSHRFKKKRGPRRPSFIDTGALEASFVAWMTQ